MQGPGEESTTPAGAPWEGGGGWDWGPLRRRPPPASIWTAPEAAAGACPCHALQLARVRRPSQSHRADFLVPCSSQKSVWLPSCLPKSASFLINLTFWNRRRKLQASALPFSSLRCGQRTAPSGSTSGPSCARLGPQCVPPGVLSAHSGPGLLVSPQRWGHQPKGSHVPSAWRELLRARGSPRGAGTSPRKQPSFSKATRFGVRGGRKRTDVGVTGSGNPRYVMATCSLCFWGNESYGVSPFVS